MGDLKKCYSSDLRLNSPLTSTKKCNFKKQLEFIYSGLPYLQKKLYILGTNYQSTHSFIDKNGMTIEDWPTSFQTLGIYRKLFRIFTYQWKLHIYVREKDGK